MAKTLNTAAIATWVPNATHSTTGSGSVTIPAAALFPSLAGASGATLSNDIRQLLLGLLDVAYNSYNTDATNETSPVAGTDYPSSITISRAVLANSVQFAVTINTSGHATLPTYA